MERFSSRITRAGCWLAMLVLAAQLVLSPVLANDSGTPIAPAVENMAADPTATPADPEPTPTEPVPTATEPAPTPTTEPTPLPTATLQPTLGYALAAEPECRVADGQPAELASGGEIEYRCISLITLDGEHIDPAGIDLVWSIEAAITPGWIAQLLPPSRTPDDSPAWIDATDNVTQFTFEQTGVAGSAADVSPLSSQIEIVYKLRIVRPACLVSEPMVELRHAASVSAPLVAAIDRNAGIPLEPLRIAPELAAIAAPSVAFDGGLDFGTITATAAGLSETRIDGTLGVTVSGLDQACGVWDLQFSATPIVDEHGDTRDGFALLLGECDLADSCVGLTVTAGPDAPASYSTMFTFTLRTPLHAALGALGTTLDATLIPSAESQKGGVAGGL